MKVKMLVDTRVFFAKGSEVEVDEREAKRLSALGFAEITAEKVEVPQEEEEEKPAKKVGRPKKEK